MIFSQKRYTPKLARNAAIMAAHMKGASFARIGADAHLSAERVRQITQWQIRAQRSPRQRQQYRLYLSYIKDWREMMAGS